MIHLSLRFFNIFKKNIPKILFINISSIKQARKRLESRLIPFVLVLTYSYRIYIHTESAWVSGGSPIGPIIDELVLKHSTLFFFFFFPFTFFPFAEICCSAERISRGVVVNHVLSFFLSYLSDVHGAALTSGLFRPGGLVPLSILDDTTALQNGRRSTGTYYRRHRCCPHLRIQQGIALNNAKS